MPERRTLRPLTLAALGAALLSCQAPAAIVTSRSLNVESVTISGTVRVPAGLAAAGSAHLGLLSLAEKPVAGVEVYLADAALVPVPGVASVLSDASGAYRLTGVPVGRPFLVAARVQLTGGGKTQLERMVKTVPGGVVADLDLASTFVSAAVVAGNDNHLGDFDPGKLQDVITATGPVLLTTDVAVLADATTLVTRMAALAQQVAAIKTGLAAIQSQFSVSENGPGSPLTPPPVTPSSATPTPAATLPDAFAGRISTYAGVASQGSAGDGAAATAAQLYTPIGVALDAAGSLYIADTLNSNIRKVTTGGAISDYAGAVGPGFFGHIIVIETTFENTGGAAGDGGPATAAQLASPQGVALDAAGNLYIADSENNKIRKVGPTGTISLYAGTGTEGASGDGGPATAAQLDSPTGVALDAAGNVYVADTLNNRIRKITPGGVISTVAGTGTPGATGDGGPASAAQLDKPWSVAVDAAGNLYIADTENKRIRKVTPDGMIHTVAGGGQTDPAENGGAATDALLSKAQGVAVDATGTLYIADTAHSLVRKVTPDGLIATVAGTGVAGFSGDGGDGTLAQLNQPEGVALDAAGNLFIADTNNFRVREVLAESVNKGLPK